MAPRSKFYDVPAESRAAELSNQELGRRLRAITRYPGHYAPAHQRATLLEAAARLEEGANFFDTVRNHG